MEVGSVGMGFSGERNLKITNFFEEERYLKHNFHLFWVPKMLIFRFLCVCLFFETPCFWWLEGFFSSKPQPAGWVAAVAYIVATLLCY